MASIDKLRPGMRALVHEYGAAIVGKMIGEGYRDPSDLAPILETWRFRRQQKLFESMANGGR